MPSYNNLLCIETSKELIAILIECINVSRNIKVFVNLPNRGKVGDGVWLGMKVWLLMIRILKLRILKNNLLI